jgi:hypothetical protein
MKTEREQQDEFVQLVGGMARAERLSRISQDSYPMPSWSIGLGHHKVSGKEVFRNKAKREGFSDKEINCFLAL